LITQTLSACKGNALNGDIFNLICNLPCAYIVSQKKGELLQCKVKVKLVKFQLNIITTGLLIELLWPPRLSQRSESATPLPGKNCYAQDRTRIGGFIANVSEIMQMTLYLVLFHIQNFDALFSK